MFYTRPQPRRRGFTLIEAAMTTMIVGIGVAATLQLLAAGTAANVDGTKTTTGVHFAKAIRELTIKSSFDEVRAMDNRVHNPPVDSRGMNVADFGNWTQTIDVQAVEPDRLTLNVVDPTPDAVRVTVRVTANGENVCELSWYRFRPTP
jgi:prepilin-type N-terminal cleavage/methylation domain-containing protein